MIKFFIEMCKMRYNATILGWQIEQLGKTATKFVGCITSCTNKIGNSCVKTYKRITGKK